MKIKTTHVGSLPRPEEMNIKNLKKIPITQDDLRTYLQQILEKQISLGVTYINNGELPRADYINATVNRIAGFNGSGIAPMPLDLEQLPDYARRFGGRNGLITLNPKAPVKLPACSDRLSYVGEASLRAELDMMVSVFDEVKKNYPRCDSELFFTSPSPGTIALFLENNYYPDYESYVHALASELQQEYQIINSYGIQLQIDCPDLAMGRHTRFKRLQDNEFLAVIDTNVSALNQALAHVDSSRCRVHICWGNYPGTHHCDIELKKIYQRVLGVKPRFISLESSNHRHAHEWEVFNDFPFPEDKVLLPGVIDTTSNNIEHPELVAQRITKFARLLGPERIIGSTDCGFASTASATAVTGEVAWLKLAALVEGANLAAAKLP